MKNIILLCFLFLSITTGFAQRQYYLSSSTGNDSSNGSQAQPWKTLEKIRNTTLGPGDIVYF